MTTPSTGLNNQSRLRYFTATHGVAVHIEFVSADEGNNRLTGNVGMIDGSRLQSINFSHAELLVEAANAKLKTAGTYYGGSL